MFRGRDMYHAWRRQEIGTKFWLKYLKGRDYSEDLAVNGDNIKMDLKVINRTGVVGCVDLTQIRD
jgi:hypothetical protein